MSDYLVIESQITSCIEVPPGGSAHASRLDILRRRDIALEGPILSGIIRVIQYSDQVHFLQMILRFSPD